MQIRLFFLLILVSMIMSSCIPKKEPIGMGGLVEIIKKQELNLVEYRYHDMVFLHKRDNARKKLRMIVKYPVKIEAFVDLSTISIDQFTKTINLDHPQVKPAIIDFTEAEIIRVRDGFLSLFGGNRTAILESLRNRMGDSQVRITENAIKLGIVDQAKKDTEQFVLGFLALVDDAQYTVKFKPQDETVDKGVEFIDENTKLNYIEIFDENLFSE